MLILNERKFIQNIIETNIIDKNVGIMRYASMLAKLYNVDNIEKKELILQVRQTMNVLNFDNYYEFKYIDKIKKICSDVISENLKLKEIENIPVYKSELEFIEKNSESQREKKFLFVLFVLGRFNNNSGWSNIAITDIFKIANIHMTKKSQDELIYKMSKIKNVISTSSGNNKLNYHIELIEDDTPEIFVYDFNNLGNLYISHINPNKKLCINCGRLISIKGKNQKYCEKCKKEIVRVANKNRVSKHREEQKCNAF